MKSLLRPVLGPLVVFALAPVLGLAQSVISINIAGGNANSPSAGGGGGQGLVTGNAGLGQLGNWNNAIGASNVGAGLTLPALVNSTGAATSTSFTWSTNNTWSTSTANGAGGDVDMMSGYLDNFHANGSITVAGLGAEYTSQGYDVLVYYQTDNGGMTAGFTVTDNAGNTDTRFGHQLTANNNWPLAGGTDGYVISTETANNTLFSANIVQLSGFSGSDFTMTGNAGSVGSARARPNAIQIIGTDIPGLADLENDPATGITSNSATLHGEVTDIGDEAPSVTIFYGADDAGADAPAWDASVNVPGTQNGTFSSAVSGLTAGAPYFFRARASNSAGVSWAQPALSFTTPQLPATLVNIAASGIAAQTATVGANVTDTGGDPPTVTIYYGTVDAGTGAGNWQQSRSLGVVSASSTAPITGLTQNTTYFFRAFATNGGGGSWAPASSSFATLGVTLPTIENDAATGVTGTSANLRGEVTDDGLDPPLVTIYYGLTDEGSRAGNWDDSVTVGIDSGSFTQFLGGLNPLTTYYYTARASNTAGAAWATPSQSFTTTSVIPNNVVINEIHYDPEPKTEPVEFIELYNAGASAPNMSGWRFTSGVSFTFPPGTSLETGQYLVIAADPAAFNTKFGFTPLGPWTGGLKNDGELIRLVDAGNIVQDEVDYGVGFPWPTGSLDSGKSVELINPSLDNDLGGHWRTGGDSAGTGNTLIGIETDWKYFKGTAEPSVVTGEWRQVSFADGGWSMGQGTIGYGEGFLNTILTDMRGGYSTVYLRKTFSVANPAAIAGLVLRARYDDGFNGWINGTRVEWDQVSAANLSNTTTTGNASEDLSYREMTLPNPQGYLVAGSNVLAVQLVNASLGGSSDAFWDAELVVSTGTSGVSPGQANGSFTADVPPAIRQVDHSPEEPTSVDAVVVTAKVTDADGVQSVVLSYQSVLPGNYIRLSDAAYDNPANWTSLAMGDDGTGDDLFAGDDVFTVTLPAAIQGHRRLIRYRITVEDADNNSAQVPYRDDPQPNFAYFVYDGTPGWTGRHQPPGGTSTTFSPALLDSVATYHLITRQPDHEDAQHIPDSSSGAYGGSDYLWEGTLVYEGKVYDHVRYRARGGVWRYSMGKNMWKFRFHNGHGFEARDDYGKKYPEPWRRLNFSALIQQGNFLHRGEQGLFEGVGFRLFNLTGVEGPHTNYVHFRIIESASETGADQYSGDFQGLYLVIEQPDGRFLKTHGMEEANIYKMENGTGEGGIGGDLKYQAGPGLPADSSDLVAFKNTYQGGTQSDAWWQTNFDLERYYAYRTIVDGIHHYDIAGGKNYYYFHNAGTGKWEVHPWDLDLTWANNMYGSGNEPFKSRVLSKTAFSLGNQNRAREILDLLFNNDQAFRLIEEQMSHVYTAGQPSLVEADRFMWDYNPILTSGYVNSSKAGHGRFYQSAVSPGGFAGMAQKLKNYVLERKGWIESNTLNLTPPNKPSISYIGEVGFPVTGLSFQSSSFAGAGMSADMIAWRIGEVYDPGNTPLDYLAGTPYRYEIDSVWEAAPAGWGGGVVRMGIPVNALVPGHTYRARVRHRASNGRWSSWSDPMEFRAGAADVGLYQSNLVVSELMYHPKDASITEIGSGYSSADFEFVELYNAGPIALDLSNVQFTDGIDFTFAGSAITALASGARVLVVRNQAAFQSRYGGALPVAGEYLTSNFSNDGERVELSIGLGSPILSFTYNDQLPWPVGADDGVNGYPLVLLDPDGMPDHNNAAGWVAGAVSGGNPGGVDLGGFPLWLSGFGLSALPGDDVDGDGIAILLEYVFAGGSPLVLNSTTLPSLAPEQLDVGGGLQDYAVFEYAIRSGLNDVNIAVETSSDLATWTSPGEIVFLEQVDHGDGTLTVRYRTSNPVASGDGPLFARVRVVFMGP
jgi:hypothetical protein